MVLENYSNGTSRFRSRFSFYSGPFRSGLLPRGKRGECFQSGELESDARGSDPGASQVQLDTSRRFVSCVELRNKDIAPPELRASLGQALQIRRACFDVASDCTRTLIVVYFHILKSGCSCQNAQLRTLTAPVAVATLVGNITALSTLSEPLIAPSAGSPPYTTSVLLPLLPASPQGLLEIIQANTNNRHCLTGAKIA
jgi:hypothetical protein